MKTIATIDSASDTFTIRKGVWSGTFPVGDLPKWLSFYKLQQQRFPDHAGEYEGDVKALEAIAHRLRG